MSSLRSFWFSRLIRSSSVSLYFRVTGNPKSFSSRSFKLHVQTIGVNAMPRSVPATADLTNSILFVIRTTRMSLLKWHFNLQTACNRKTKRSIYANGQTHKNTHWNKGNIIEKNVQRRTDRSKQKEAGTHKHTHQNHKQSTQRSKHTQTNNTKTLSHKTKWTHKKKKNKAKCCKKVKN